MVSSLVMKLDPNNFFDLEPFDHRAVFENGDQVWDALKHLKDYFSQVELGNIDAPIPESAVLVNPELISIGPGTVIEPGSFIQGPCVLGKGCFVRHGAYIRGFCLAGDECVIGHATEVKHAIFLNRAKAAHFAYVGDSILGNEVNLGAGTKCANLRFDHSEVYVNCDGERLPTGLKKLGAIFGDQSQTGCNAVTNPGTLFAKEASCYPCANVGGVVLKSTKSFNTKV